MKSSFTKGNIVKTTDHATRQINKGRIQDTIINRGVVIGNEHFGRIVKVKLDNNQIVCTKPEYLELI